MKYLTLNYWLDKFVGYNKDDAPTNWADSQDSCENYQEQINNQFINQFTAGMEKRKQALEKRNQIIK